MKLTSIDHRQVEDDMRVVQEISDWIVDNGGTVCWPFLPDAENVLSIHTSDGMKRASLGDWIVKVSHGKFVVRKDGI